MHRREPDAWAAKLIRVCDDVIERLAATGDPKTTPLAEDIAALRHRLQRQLAAGDADQDLHRSDSPTRDEGASVGK